MLVSRCEGMFRITNAIEEGGEGGDWGPPFISQSQLWQPGPGAGHREWPRPPRTLSLKAPCPSSLSFACSGFPWIVFATVEDRFSCFLHNYHCLLTLILSQARPRRIKVLLMISRWFFVRRKVGEAFESPKTSTDDPWDFIGYLPLLLSPKFI